MNVDNLFTTVFTIAFLPVIGMYAYGILTAMIGRPSRHNESMLVPGWLLTVAGVISALSCVMFLSAGLANAALTVLLGMLGWAAASVMLVMVTPPSYVRN